MHDIEDQPRRLKIGSLFSGYGGLDLAVEHVFNADTVWFSELNEPVAAVFPRHWPGVPNLGDITLTTRFTDHGPAGALTLPGTFATQVDDFTTAEYRVTSTVAGDGTVAAPDALRAAAVPAPAAPTVTSDEVAPGVWLLAGQSHHSVLVAFTDRLVLIEAPQSEARTKAVLAKARELAPATPLTTLVVSHHHFDHSAGLRAALADGLSVVTHEGNATFVTTMAGRPFTRQPDALATVKAPGLGLQTVPGSRTLTDGTRSLVLYHLAGNPHSDTLLMAYLPKERVLIEALVREYGCGVLNA